MDDIRDCFRILDLEPGASLEEIKRSYRELVRVWHPDRFRSDPKLQAKAEEKLKQINLAYERLSNEAAAEASHNGAATKTKAATNPAPERTGSDDGATHVPPNKDTQARPSRDGPSGEGTHAQTPDHSARWKWAIASLVALLIIAGTLSEKPRQSVSSARLPLPTNTPAQESTPTEPTFDVDGKVNGWLKYHDELLLNEQFNQIKDKTAQKAVVDDLAGNIDSEVDALHDKGVPAATIMRIRKDLEDKKKESHARIDAGDKPVTEKQRHDELIKRHPDIKDLPPDKQARALRVYGFVDKELHNEDFIKNRGYIAKHLGLPDSFVNGDGFFNKSATHVEQELHKMANDEQHGAISAMLNLAAANYDPTDPTQVATIAAYRDFGKEKRQGKQGDGLPMTKQKLATNGIDPSESKHLEADGSRATSQKSIYGPDGKIDPLKTLRRNTPSVSVKAVSPTVNMKVNVKDFLEANTEASQQSQRLAMTKYPDLKHEGSAFHTKFVELYNAALKDRGVRLDEPNWPMVMADETMRVLAANWRASSKIDPIDDSRTTVFSVEGVAPSDDNEPPLKPRLVVRFAREKNEVYIVIPEREQKSYEIGGIRFPLVTAPVLPIFSGSKKVEAKVRWGKSPPIIETWEPSTDFQAIFAPAPQEIIRHLLERSQLLIQATPERGKAILVNFSVVGFKEALAPYPDLKKAFPLR